VHLYTTIAYNQNQEGYKTPILCDFGYGNRNDKGNILKAEMKFMKFCWRYAVRGAISDFTVRSELQKWKGGWTSDREVGRSLITTGACLMEQVDKLAVGMLDVGREDGRLVYEDSRTIGRDPTGRP